MSLSDLLTLLRLMLESMAGGKYTDFVAKLKTAKFICTDKATGKVYAGFPLPEDWPGFANSLRAFLKKIAQLAKSEV